VLLLELVAVNLYAVKGPPDTPVVEALTVKVSSVLETNVGAGGVPGPIPVVI
jgi:hypothetical protein